MTAREPIPEAATMKAHALAYAQRGWRLFPVFEVVEKEGAWICTCGEGERCPRPGKHPRTRDGLKEATTDLVTIEKWWTRFPNASIGIATGRASNLTVVDADASGGKAGVVNITALSAKNGGLPATLVADTGGGGLHIYFLFTERLTNGTNVIAEAIDIRNEGGFVVAPPSRHVSGRQYAWRNEGRGNLMTAPDWLAPSSERRTEPPARVRGRKRSKPGFALEKLESMLGVLDPDDRDLWRNVFLIAGRLYVNTPLEQEAYEVCRTWAERSPKADEDKAGNERRQREAFFELSQEEPRTGGKPLTIGTLIAAAKEAGWKPFGDRECVPWKPGDESEMASALVQTLVRRPDNTIFEVMGEVVDVQRARLPIMRIIKFARERGQPEPEGLMVRRTACATLLSRLSEVAVLETMTKEGAPEAMPIPERLGAIILKAHAHEFDTLAGVAAWPMVGTDGELIARNRGYDKTTGLYFNIDPGVRIDERLSSEQAAVWLRTELLADFPFEETADFATALGMLLAFMQRPLMKTCPAFAAIAPQAGTGKSTLIEIASLTVHGESVAMHPLPDHDEEFRKAVHSILLAKLPAVLFDNIGQGKLIDSDHLAKLITAETATDRTLGASETRKQVNSLLITMTGNNIAFGRDLSSRVLPIRLNARAANPFKRTFRHHDIKQWVLGERNATLSALVAIARAGIRFEFAEGDASRFEDFDRLIAAPVMAVTGVDLRARMIESAEQESEDDSNRRAALELIARWQQKWRNEGNGRPWRARDLVDAVDAKLFDDAGLKILARAVGAEAWEASPAKALGLLLRTLNGDHRFDPMVLTSQHDRVRNVALWFIKGAAHAADRTEEASGGF